MSDAVLTGELTDPLGRRGLVELLDLDVQRTSGTGDPAADPGAADAAHHQRLGAVGQLPGTFDLGDRADGRELAVDPGHHHETSADGLGRGGGPLGLVALEGDRDDHSRQHDPGVEREEREERSLGV